MEEEVGRRVAPARSDADRVLRELESRGLLLLQDKQLPNAVTLIAGETVRGSWWGHPRSHEIFRVLTEVGASLDVVSCKLVSGKVTLVHRRLWPALLAVATSGERWQTEGLSRGARSLLRRVRESGTAASSGAAIKELERRLRVTPSRSTPTRERTGSSPKPGKPGPGG